MRERERESRAESAGACYLPKKSKKHKKRK